MDVTDKARMAKLMKQANAEQDPAKAQQLWDLANSLDKTRIDPSTQRPSR